MAKPSLSAQHRALQRQRGWQRISAVIRGEDHLSPEKRRLFDSLCGISGDGCWPWLGALNNRGYGKFFLACSSVAAHRLSYAIHVAPILDDSFVCHRCDNPICIRPGHLFLGTPQDNAVDAYRKGRMDYPHAAGGAATRGSVNGMAKLAEQDIPEIWRRLLSGESKAAIGRSYGVSQSAIYMIRAGVNWRHLMPPCGILESP